MYLKNFAQLSENYHDQLRGLSEYLAEPDVKALGWPADVVEQWLFDHANNDSFLRDYAHVNLREIRWEEQRVELETLLTIETGPSDRRSLEEYAENPDHWVAVRKTGIHRGVAGKWENE